MKTSLLRLLALVPLMALFAVPSHAYRFTLEGKADGQYPVVIEVDRTFNGAITGRYAYKATLSRQGRDKRSSWLYITPLELSTMDYVIKDSEGRVQEHWSDVFMTRANGRNTLKATVTNAKGKSFTLTAASAPSSSAKSDSDTSDARMAEYFRSHLGSYPFDFDMFSTRAVKRRFEAMMGKRDFEYMLSAFQSQTPIEYASGMFWSGGFENHNCCDPYVIWAYDTRNGSFYVMVRRDGRDYWWSETGSAPYEFHELVNSQI